MPRLHASDLLQFARGYRFAAARVRRVRVLTRRGRLTVEVVVAVRKPDDTPVRLKLTLTSVDEYRFQKRLAVAADRPTRVSFAAFNGVIFVNFDAWPLSPGDVPGVHDFRASDAYAAGGELAWELVPPKPATP